jgi:hydrogenase maturation protein HypF
MTSPSNPAASLSRRLAITVRGVVQGVGFRPFVYNAACERGLIGWVRNEADMVRIEVQGDSAALDSLVEAIRHAAPPQARVETVDVREIPAEPLPTAGAPVFKIIMSEGTAPPRPTIPADLATCDECLAEIRDPAQRRYGYPFTNCTRCGPRWSIIERLPYDRPRTSMAAFVMCPDCQAEYDNPADRRFHAQPIACPRCGPMLQLLDPTGRETAAGQAAFDATVQMLLSGKIVALKGLGGFQLLVDATNAEAVARLRQRKRRPDRPFALMLPTLDDVKHHCHVTEQEARELLSHQSPIVLLRRRAECDAASGSQPANGIHHSSFIIHHSSTPFPLLGVAPGNPYLGVMLPYTPLHHLLMAAVARPLVCTSGNLSEEPMAIAVEDAIKRLGTITDAILTHNRPIVRPVDDSIVRVGPDGPQTLRRARGFAPLPIELDVEPGDAPAILAVGGHLKNTVALLLGTPRQETNENSRELTAPGVLLERASTHPAQVVLSAHVGDLDSTLSVDVFRRAIDDLLEFFQTTPGAVVCDLHPDYASTRHAEQLAARWGVPLLRVQHHHAHVAACMAEHGLQGPVLGLSWDGTGYGPDGTVWGGEMLVCEGANHSRAAHLRTFALPGGDRAAREPRRSALGLLFEIFGQQAGQYAAEWFRPGELDTLLSMLARGVNSPRTSSMGRLFDAVAALCGLPPVISFEGQAAMALEFAADPHEEAAYPVPIQDVSSQPPTCVSEFGGADIPVCRQSLVYSADKNVCPAGHRTDDLSPVGKKCRLVIDWAPLVRDVLADRAAGVPTSRISARFHNALANMALEVAKAVAPGLPIVLTGGCFQNALLTARVQARLSEAGHLVYTHSRVPPGDGGIALGQTLLALRRRSTVGERLLQ